MEAHGFVYNSIGAGFIDCVIFNSGTPYACTGREYAAEGAGYFATIVPIARPLVEGEIVAKVAVATAKELNKIAHVFPRVEKSLKSLVNASGGSELEALRAVQEAANRALAEGKLTAGPNGILPGGGRGAVLDVNGVSVQLIGGRIVDGAVELGSFVGL